MKPPPPFLLASTATSASAKDNDIKLRRLPKPNPDHLRCPPTMNFDTTTNLPTNGFYVIENLGKNRILVDLERIEQGDSIVLRSGSAIRYVNVYNIYKILYISL